MTTDIEDIILVLRKIGLDEEKIKYAMRNGDGCLDLGDNKIGDEGARALSEALKTNTTLREFEFDGFREFEAYKNFYDFY